MNRTVIGVIITLVFLQLLNVPPARLIQGMFVVFYLIVLGLTWIFTGNKPGRQHILAAIGLVLGPTVLIAVASEVLLAIQVMSVRYALVGLLLVILAAIYGPKLVKKSKH